MKSPLRLIPLFLLSLLGRAPAAQEIVVASYNLENYVSAQPKQPGQKYATKAKSEKEIAAVVQIIKEINPDIIGVCEMGSPERFEDLKKRLNDAGLGYVDGEYLPAVDQERHLALLSRFPIVSRNSRADVSYELSGQPEKVRRGILDVTVQVNPGYQLRLVGVHLKSKLPVPQGEALIRRLEAQQVRQHLDAILTATPQTNLICYGDFNDTKNEPVYQEVVGLPGTALRMTDLRAQDDLGDKWTHYWKTADLYSRIDYLFVSPALAKEVTRDRARVYRSPYWNDASDHRAIFTTITAENTK